MSSSCSKGTDTRYLKVGGNNALYIDADHDRQLQELTSYYPPAFRVLCDAHAKALEILRTYSNIAMPTALRTGTTTSRAKRSLQARRRHRENDYISYADHAKAMVGVLESGQYLRQRITLNHDDKPTSAQEGA